MLKHGLLRLAAGLVVVLLLAACAANQDPVSSQEGAPLQGTWRITAASHCPHVCAMDAKEAARLAGTVLKYTAAAFSNGQVTCPSPRFSRRGWTTEDFLSQYRFNAETLGIKGPVIEELSVQCGDSRVSGPLFGATVIVKNHRTILVPWDGVFFEANRE